MDFRRQRRKNQSAWEEKGALYSQPTPIFSSLLWGQLSPRSNRGNNLGMPVKKKRGGGLHKTLSRKIGGAKQDTKPPTQKWSGEKIIWNVYLRLFTLHKHFLKGTFNSDLCEFKCPCCHERINWPHDLLHFHRALPDASLFRHFVSVLTPAHNDDVSIDTRLEREERRKVSSSISISH